MENQEYRKFENISQRAAYAYLQAQAELRVGQAQAFGLQQMTAWAEQQGALYAFFKDLYVSLYTDPGRFGLPLSADLSLAENEPNAKDKKQQVKKLLDKPRAMIDAGLNFLMLAGVKGVLEGQALHLDGYQEIVKQSKIGKKFLEALAAEGLLISATNGGCSITHARFPQMMPALKSFATRCAAFENERLGKIQFARCDQAAGVDEIPSALDLYRAFEGDEYDRLLRLHAYFTGRGYQHEVEAWNASGWVVKYQGSRKVKSTPLFEVGFDDRYTRPLRVQIKCASTGRIAGLLAGQSQALQDDFMSRVYPCQGNKCGWCRNNKTLGPTTFIRNGEPVTVCWYSNGDVKVFDDRMEALIMEYEQMHTRLAAG